MAHVATSPYPLRIVYKISIFICLFFLGSQAIAQTDPAGGIVPFSSQTGGQYDSIDLASSNILIRIPVRTKAGKISFGFELVANSHYSIQGPTWFNPMESVGMFGGPLLSSFGASFSAVPKNFGSCAGHSSDWGWYNYQITDSLGGIHPLPFFQFDQYGCYRSATGYTSDGSGFALSGATGSVELYDKSGNNITLTLTDPDGTTMVETQNNSQIPNIWTWTDTLGLTAITGSLAGGGTRLTGSGGFGPGPNAYSYTDNDGETQKFTVSYTGYSLKSNFLCSGIADVDDGTTYTTYLPTSVTLPDNSQLLIVYEKTPNGNSTNVTGRIQSLTLPTGGTITYEYAGGNSGINCSSGVVPTLTRTINDNNGHSDKWIYVNTNGSAGPSNYTVTVTDPANNNTVYTFTGEYQTEKQVYQGPVSPSHLLSTTVTCYNQFFSNCPSLSTPPTYIGQTDVFTYLTTSTSASLLETTFNNINGTVAEVKKYDFGAATTLPPTKAPTVAALSDTTTTYDGQNGASCGALTNTFIRDRPCSVTTVNSSGVPVSQVNYTYNGTGHPTQISTLVSGSTYLTSSATYNPSNGTPNVVTDINGTTYTYAYNGTHGCSSLLPTSVKIAGAGLPSGGLTNTTEWNCDGGVATETLDPNGQPTTYTYNDPFWRLTSMKDAMNNTTTYSYTANTFESVLTFNGASTVDKLTTTDGVGRPIYSQTKQAPGSSNFDSVQSTYSWSNGGTQTKVTMPYVGTAGQPAPTGTATTTTQTDALGRPITITDAAGGTTTYSYPLNDVLQTVGPSPQRFQRNFEYNGLGQLTSVCEVNSLSGSGACGQKNAETGFLTSYTYNPLGNLLSVVQNTQLNAIGGTQSRNYVYDGLGRLTSESNPETSNTGQNGITTYTYDSTSALCSGGGPATYKGDLIMSTGAGGNCLVYFHDGLHRLTDVGSNAQSATNPCRRFRYDNSSGYSGSTKPSGLANYSGRLIEAATDSCVAVNNDTLLTDEWFNYDADGRTANVYESTPNSGGYYNVSASYWANGALETLGGVPGLNSLSFTPDGEGRPSSVSYGTTNWVTGTTYYPTNTQTTVTFGNGDNDVYGYDSAGRVNSFQFNVGSPVQSLTGTPTWSANGTLASLGIVDQLNSANTQTCSYGYDALSRITATNCVNGSNNIWNQSFTVDTFGNISKSGSSSFAATYLLPNNTTNNQEQTDSSCVPAYDGNGNMTTDCTDNHSYSWDVYGRPVTMNGINITFDAFGREAEMSSSPILQILYSPIGKLGLMNGQSAKAIRIPLPGGSTAELLGPTGATTDILHTDWLGSSRLAISYNGHSMSYDTAYAPYGENYAHAGNLPSTLDFTGQMKDTLTDLFDFTNREYNPVQGRWLSPDPAGLAAVNSSNPQSWNRYAYALNNPLRYTDPLGLYCFYGGDGDTPENDSDESDYNYDEHGLQGMADCAQEGGQWYQDFTSVTVNGDSPGDVATLENGTQIFPQTVPREQSFADCVKSGGSYFSLANGLNNITGGATASGVPGALNEAFLGNTVSDVIGLFQGESGPVQNALIEKGGPEAATAVASAIPNVTYTTTTTATAYVQTPTSSVTLTAAESTTSVLPLGNLAHTATSFATEALETFTMVVKLPIDLSASSFSAVVCGIGR